MTKVQLGFALERALDEATIERIAAMHGIYGMGRVQPTASLDGLVVDYDASRLTESDVEAALRRAGLPVVRRD